MSRQHGKRRCYRCGERVWRNSLREVQTITGEKAWACKTREKCFERLAAGVMVVRNPADLHNAELTEEERDAFIAALHECDF